jgi:hypothetical protein
MADVIAGFIRYAKDNPDEQKWAGNPTGAPVAGIESSTVNTSLIRCRAEHHAIDDGWIRSLAL